MSCSLNHYSQQPRYGNNISVRWWRREFFTWTCTHPWKVTPEKSFRGNFPGPVFQSWGAGDSSFILSPWLSTMCCTQRRDGAKDLGCVHLLLTYCLLTGGRVCVCVALLFTHTSTHRKWRTHRRARLFTSSSHRRILLVWYSCLILKWNIQPKIFHPILKSWKTLRFDWKVQAAATYRGLCCIRLSCLPKLHALIPTSTGFLSLGTTDTLGHISLCWGWGGGWSRPEH